MFANVPRPWFAVLALFFGLAGCTGTDGGVAAEQVGQATTVSRASTSSSISTTTTTTNPTTTENSEMDDQRATDGCRLLTDFDDDRGNRSWQVVNDDVMGGRSLGGLSFDDGVMIFEGDINTDGGGFASLRLPLEQEALVDHDRIVFRARPDGRSYMVTFDDDLASRDRRVSHRAPIGFGPSGEWQVVSVAFEDLFPAIFGRPIEDLPFRKDLANRLGLMISDGRDGPFRLEVDWVELCPGDG